MYSGEGRQQQHWAKKSSILGTIWTLFSSCSCQNYIQQDSCKALALSPNITMMKMYFQLKLSQCQAQPVHLKLLRGLEPLAGVWWGKSTDSTQGSHQLWASLLTKLPQVKNKTEIQNIWYLFGPFCAIKMLFMWLNLTHIKNDRGTF